MKAGVRQIRRTPADFLCNSFFYKVLKKSQTAGFGGFCFLEPHMNIDKVLAARLNAAMDIGELIGQTKAFTRIAGRCTAAKAQALTAIHDEKQYRKLGMDWNGFCQNKVGINRRLADQIIREFKEFGPQYFDLAQVTPINAAQYRLIAASVSEQGLTHAGETIAFTEKNAPRLAAAVADLRKAAEPPAGKTPPSAENETWKMV